MAAVDDIVDYVRVRVDNVVLVDVLANSVVAVVLVVVVVATGIFALLLHVSASARQAAWPPLESDKCNGQTAAASARFRTVMSYE